MGVPPIGKSATVPATGMFHMVDCRMDNHVISTVWGCCEQLGVTPTRRGPRPAWWPYGSSHMDQPEVGALALAEVGAIGAAVDLPSVVVLSDTWDLIVRARSADGLAIACRERQWDVLRAHQYVDRLRVMLSITEFVDGA